MSQQTRGTILKKLDTFQEMPTLPVSLVPLLRYMEKPMEQMELQQIVDLVAQDKALAAQCLHMANSPLFGRRQAPQTIRDAVVALGFQRMRDIVVSCSVLSLSPRDNGGIDPTVFWEHSLGCALVCRQFAVGIGFDDPNKAYLCGLLHDIGIIAHLWIAPNEFRGVVEQARKNGEPLHEAESSAMGIDHAETGKMVARRWKFSDDLVEVAGHHHDPSTASVHRNLVALVSLSDMLCRMSGLGHGIVETRQIDFLEQPGFALLSNECPSLKDFDWARFTFQLESYLEEVHRLVNVLYRPQ
jgi:HD-like signal output (HDOD) protein